MSKIALQWVVMALCLSIAFGAALADGDAVKKNRILDKELSHQEHFDDEEHNPDYDHEAFLGEEEAREFETLTPEESQERLASIVDKIDKDQDGSVTHLELKEWIEYSQNKYIIDDVKRQWASHNPQDKDALPWVEYKATVYGFLENLEPEDLESDAEGMSYMEMLKRDEKRWAKADRDQDGGLSFEEFTDFLHPENAKHMSEIVIEETMEDIDKDKDGQISLEEYIGDMYSITEDDESEEPSWVESEREQFSAFRDKDKSGSMDMQEVRDWILPSDLDHASNEATHLISEADSDKDYVLSKSEILENYDLFVGSQATDFGEALTANHDEF